MREHLEKIENVRDCFTGEFVRFGIKNGYKGPLKTVLLKDIKDKEGNSVCDHLWFNLTLGFENLMLQEGDRIEFNARVKQYVKGYFGYREDVYKPIEQDYKLSHPTKVRKIIDYK
jgi:hypothetical protein